MGQLYSIWFMFFKGSVFLALIDDGFYFLKGLLISGSRQKKYSG